MRSTSSRSTEEKSKLPSGEVGSLTGAPSIITSVLSEGAPRIITEVTPPNAPWRLIWTPGRVSSTSKAKLAWRSWTSWLVITWTSGARLWGVGRRVAVTTRSWTGVGSRSSAAARAAASITDAARSHGAMRDMVRLSSAMSLQRKSAPPAWSRAIERATRRQVSWLTGHRILSRLPGPGGPVASRPGGRDADAILAAHSCGHSGGLGANPAPPSLFAPVSRGTT